MKNLLTPLTESLGPFGPIIVVGILGILMLAVAIPMILSQREDPIEKFRRREDERAAGYDSTEAGEAGRLRARTKRDKLEKYASFLEPQDMEKYSATRMMLQRAGYRSREAMRLFTFMQLTIGVGLLIVGVSYVVLSGATSDEETSLVNTMTWTLGPALVGYMLPRFWVNSRGEKRVKEIESGFPDALDLLLVCVEAGQSLDQAIMRVARELKLSFPALSEELSLVAYEVKAGKDRSTVLRDFAERCTVPDISSFVTVLIQSTQFGTPVSQALRVYSAEMRDKRLMRAEEIANKLPTKMTLMTMGLTVPPLMIILVGPSVYDVMQVLSGGGIGGN
jgi:tight adherence protein C